MLAWVCPALGSVCPAEPLKLLCQVSPQQVYNLWLCLHPPVTFRESCAVLEHALFVIVCQLQLHVLSW